MKFPFPGLIGLHQKSPCGVSTGFREAVGEGEGWKDCWMIKVSVDSRKQREGERNSTSTGKELGFSIWWEEFNFWLKFSE